MPPPRLLMLDEPSLGLAAVMVKAIFEDPARINRQGLAAELAASGHIKQAYLGR